MNAIHFLPGYPSGKLPLDFARVRPSKPRLPEGMTAFQNHHREYDNREFEFLFFMIWSRPAMCAEFVPTTISSVYDVYSSTFVLRHSIRNRNPVELKCSTGVQYTGTLSWTSRSCSIERTALRVLLG